MNVTPHVAAGNAGSEPARPDATPPQQEVVTPAEPAAAPVAASARRPEVHYVAGQPEAVGRRPHLIVLCNDDITNFAGVRDDHEQIGWLSREAGQLTAVEIEAEAMRLYGDYEGVGGRPSHAEFPEPDPYGQMLGRVAVEVCRARTRHAADAESDALEDRTFRQYDLDAVRIAGRLRMSRADVEECLQKLCPELYRPRKEKPERKTCPVCEAPDETFNTLAYDVAVTGLVAISIVRRRHGLFPAESVGALMNAADEMGRELGECPQVVRESLSWLMAPGTGEADASIAVGEGRDAA